MNDEIEELQVLKLKNNDKKLDLFAENINLEDFTDFNECLECKYHNEDTFVNKYANSNDILFLNANVQSLASKFTHLCSFMDVLKSKHALPDVFAIQEVFKIQKDFYNIDGYFIVI